jgi:hypothetical protein
MTTHHRLGTGDTTPMTYSQEQLDMLRQHFERCGAPTDRLGLDHWLKTRVDDALRISVVAQLFPEPISMRDYVENQLNSGIPVNAIRKWLAPVMAPAARERILRDVQRSRELQAA